MNISAPFFSSWIKVLSFSLVLFAQQHLSAQQNAINEGSEIITVPAGDKFLRWYGHAGRTYFIQVSKDNDALTKWAWAPFIESGNDEEISHEVDGTPTKSFFRLLYTDQEIPFWETLETADFDQDGLTNEQEIAAGTNPLIADTDGDGYSDGEEVEANTFPLDPASFPLKVIASIPEFQAPNDNYPGYPAGQPVILYLKQPLPASVTTFPGPWLNDLSSGNAVPVSGNTIILPGRQAVAFIPAGNTFVPWAEDEDYPPIYQIDFNPVTTGQPHLLPFQKTFTTTTAAGSVDSGPWFGRISPGSGFIDAACDSIITAQWNEPLAPATVVPANVTLISSAGTSVSTTVSFDYGHNVNLLRIAPNQPLASATKYTVTLGTGFHNLTGKAHAQAVSWSFTTRPERIPPIAGGGPYVAAVTPADFSFGIAVPSTVSIRFSEAMNPATLTAAHIHLRGGNGPDLPGTFSYASATKTLSFQPAAALAPATYFALTLDLPQILSNPGSGTPIQLQSNGTFVFATATISPGGGGDGTQPPAHIDPLSLHYTWGETFDFDGDSGCSVEIKLIDKDGQQILKTLPANTEVIQVQDSGDIEPGSTVVITPTFVPGSDKDLEEEEPENGIFLIPADGALPPGMTYLIFRSTPPAQGSSDPPQVEYLGKYDESIATADISARCDTGNGGGAQTLYLVPAPVMRDIPGDSTYDFSLIEDDFAKALPGQKMNLRLEDKYVRNYGPVGVTLDNFQWTLPDKTFKDYTPDASNSNYLDVPASELTGQQEVHFYWKDSGEKEPSVDFNINIAGSQAATETSKAKIRVDKPESTFTLEIGGERVDMANDRHGEIVSMFGLFSNTSGKVSPGVKYIGSVTTPAGWPSGEWSYVQLVKSQRNYTYAGGATTHLGDGNSFKLDHQYPYSRIFPANGTVATGDDCSDTPRDSLTGKPDPNGPVTNRTSISVDDTFGTYVMFKPPGGAFSRHIPLRKARWMWGGTASASNNWNPITGKKSPGSETTGAECIDHPKWTDNTTSDHETANP